MDKMGARIRAKRLELGYTMEELGKLVGVQSSAVNKWEKGMVTTIKKATLLKLSDVLKCSPSWILGYEEELAEDSTQEEELLKHFRYLDSKEEKANAIAVLKAYVEGVKSASKK